MTMNIATLQHEILDAKRLIERNQLILALNDQSTNQQKRVDELTQQVAQLTKEKEPNNVDNAN